MGSEILAQGMAFQNKASNKQWEQMSVQEKQPQSTQKKAWICSHELKAKTHQALSSTHPHQGETLRFADSIWEFIQEHQKHKLLQNHAKKELLGLHLYAPLYKIKFYFREATGVPHTH